MTSPTDLAVVAVEYSDSSDFVEALGELVLSGVPIRMTMRGRFRDLLEPYVVIDGDLIHPARIGTIPPLRVFIAAVMVAKGEGHTVAYSRDGDAIVVSMWPKASVGDAASSTPNFVVAHERRS